MIVEFWRVAGWTGAGVAAGVALRACTPRLLATSTLGRGTWILASAATALLFGVLAWRIEAWLDLLAYSAVAAAGVPLATVDVLERRLPNALVYPVFAALAVPFAVSAAINSSGTRLAQAVFALFATGAFYLVLAIASRGGLGAGDLLTELPAGRLDDRTRSLSVIGAGLVQSRYGSWFPLLMLLPCSDWTVVAPDMKGRFTVDDTSQDVARLVVSRVGALVEVGEPVVGFRLLDEQGVEIDEVSEFLRDLRARDCSVGSLRSYGLALLRWYRFLWAIGVPWDRAGRGEARDFMLWLGSASKPDRPRKAAAPAPGSVNSVTHKPYPGRFYAPRTRRHNRTVVRMFYEHHRELGTGPLVNPMPDRRGVNGGRPSAHHNPLEPFVAGRRADFQPKVPRRQPPNIPDAAFDALFAAMPSHRDRAVAAFYISTGARASELLGVTCDRVDVGQQLIGVIRKGTGALQWLPASPDAYVWLRLYQQEFTGRISWSGQEWLWQTLRRPYRRLTYPAMRAVLQRANETLGTNWTLHDLRHTAAKRMLADPNLSLVDVQWVLGHAHVATTQLYTEPAVEEVVQRMRAHHHRRDTAVVAAPVAAAGYRPEVLATLLGTGR